MGSFTMIKRLLKLLVFKIVRLMPLLRFSKLKNFLFNLISEFKIEKGVNFSSSIKVIGNGSLKIGENSFVGHDTQFIVGEKSIKIGCNVDISSDVMFITGSHELGNPNNRSAGAGYAKDIIVEDNVWVGARVTILGGITIGQGAIIPAGTTVYKDIPKHVIAGGAPLRIIKTWCEETGEWTC